MDKLGNSTAVYLLSVGKSVTLKLSQCMRFPTMCNQQSLRSACAYAQSDQSLCSSLEYSMIVKLLTEYHLEFLSLKGNCTGSSESTHVKMPHCWRSHALAQIGFIQKAGFLHLPDRSCSNPADKCISHIQILCKNCCCKPIIVVIASFYSLIQSFKLNQLLHWTKDLQYGTYIL